MIRIESRDFTHVISSFEQNFNWLIVPGIALGVSRKIKIEE